MKVDLNMDAPLIERLVAHIRETGRGTREQAGHVAAASPAQQPEQQRALPSAAGLEKAIEAANRLVQQHTKELRFDVDDDSGRTIVRVVDLETKAVLMQIPSEEMLALAKALEDPHAGLVDSRA